MENFVSSQTFVLTAYPGPPSAPKVISAFKDCITLAWSPPANTGGTNILGYNLEKRKKGSNLWGLVNPSEEIIRGDSAFLYNLDVFCVVITPIHRLRSSATQEKLRLEPLLLHIKRS